MVAGLRLLAGPQMRAGTSGKSGPMAYTQYLRLVRAIQSRHYLAVRIDLLNR
jgi:hypothetical protein